MSAYRRTWPQRLADVAPYLGLVIIALTDMESTGPLAILAAIVAVGLIALGVERASHYRGQRDRYRRTLVDLVRDCGMRHGGSERADFFEGRVPADVLAEAFPKPTPAPRSVSEGCSDNRREVGDV